MPLRFRRSAPSRLAIAALGVVGLALSGCRTAPRPEASLSEEELMEQMMAAATPGPMQAWLLEDVGTWKGESRSWSAPGSEAYEMEASFTIVPRLGGRFTECNYESEYPGMPRFEGIAITGYDNAAGEFQAMWIDSYGTTMMTGTGKRSDDGRAIEMTYSFHCPVRHRRVLLWQEIVRESPDRQTHRMWSEAMSDGSKYLMMEAVYRRVAE